MYDPEGSAGAATALWLASKDLGELRPLRDFLRCSKANRSAVRKAAWRLDEAVRCWRPPLEEEYVGIVAARANLPAPAARRALEILARNRRAVAGRSPWVLAAVPLCLAAYKQYRMLIRLAEAACVAV